MQNYRKKINNKCKLSDQWFTISNALTLSRIIFIPFIITSIRDRMWIAAFILFSLAALTDILDGYFARLLHEPTALGKWLDPAADKLLLLSTFCALAFMHFDVLGVPLWFLVFIFLRDLIICVGIGILLCMGKRVSIRPTRGGKLTTFFQIMLILWLFLCQFYQWSPKRTYTVALIGLTFFALFSFTQYLKMGWRYAKR